MSKPRANASFRVSLRCAARGLLHVLREERNARYHLAAAGLVTLLGLWLGLTTLEWAVIVAAITLVLAGEMLNTVVERLVDLHSPRLHPLAGQAKDVSAGAVLLASVAAIIIGLLVLGPPLVARLAALFG